MLNSVQVKVDLDCILCMNCLMHRLAIYSQGLQGGRDCIIHCLICLSLFHALFDALIWPTLCSVALTYSQVCQQFYSFFHPHIVMEDHKTVQLKPAPVGIRWLISLASFQHLFSFTHSMARSWNTVTNNWTALALISRVCVTVADSQPACLSGSISWRDVKTNCSVCKGTVVISLSHLSPCCVARTL